MRYIEFADPNEYTPIDADAEEFLKQLTAGRLPDDVAPSVPVPRNRKRPPIEQRQLFDAL